MLDMNRFVARLESSQASCMDRSKWFDAYGCPEIAADTLDRPLVFLHASLRVFNGVKERDSNGNTIYNNDRETFVPLQFGYFNNVRSDYNFFN